MRIEKKKDQWVFRNLPKPFTAHHLIDALCRLPFPSPEERRQWRTEIVLPELKKQKDKDLALRVIRCWFLVSIGAEDLDGSFYPEDPEEVLNVDIERAGGKTWKDVNPLYRYVHLRGKQIYDPEYLVLLWSKQLENYDGNDRALLPVYPKDLFNQLFSPDEVREVCDLLLFRWEIQFPKTNYRERFFTSVPALAHLVYDPLGNQVFQTVYEMLTFLQTDPEEKKAATRPHLLEMLTHFVTSHPEEFQGLKIGFRFAGMDKIKLRPECLLTHYLLSKFFYFPSITAPLDESNLFMWAAPVITFTKKVTDFVDKNQKSFLTRLDMDPKTHQFIQKRVRFSYYEKKNVQRALTHLKKPRYEIFYQDTMKMLTCKVPLLP